MSSLGPVEAAVDTGQTPPLKTRIASRADSFAASPAFRVQVALLMAAVSLVGAFVSYTAAERASEASHLTALASQQYAEEQQVDQQIQAVISQDERTLVRAEPEWRAYQDDRRTADAVRASDPARAEQLDFSAQESFARYAQIYSFFRQNLPRPTIETLVSDPEAVRAEWEVWDARLFRASSTLTSADAHAAAETAAGTVATVILLVGALLLLTLGHVVGGRRGVAFAAAGAAVALAGTVWFVLLNLGASRWLLVAAVAVVLAMLVIRIPRVQTMFAGLERHSSLVSTMASAVRADPMANASPEGPTAPSFERFIAVVIACATLLGAGVGYFQAQASRTAEEAGWHAQDSGVRAIGALRGAEDEFALDLEQYEHAMVLNADAWGAAQEAEYAEFTGEAAGAGGLRAEATRREAAAQHQVDRSELVSQLGSTGVAGRAELLPLYAEVWRQAATLVGEQDAANSAAQEWGTRAGVYLSVLSWLAVAVYLLGLSITFRAAVARRVLTAVGLILIVVAAGYAITTATKPSPPADDVVMDAAQTYAAGFVLAASGDSAGAAEQYARAVELRPDFGIASRDLAQSIMEGGSARGVGFHSSFTPAAVRDAIEALESARENRADTAGVLLNLGAMQFHRAIQMKSQAAMEESLSSTERGLELGSAFEQSHAAHHYNELIGRLNHALALAGLGRIQDAADEYREVSELIFALQPWRRPLLVSSALVPLDLLGPDRESPSDDEITALKELIVSTAYGVGGSSPAQLTSAQIELFPATVQWRATIPGFDPTRDSLVVQWYRLDPDLQTWNSLPLLSGSLSLGVTTEAGLFLRDVGPDSYWGNSTRLVYDEPRSCVRSGRYRVEFYLNGHLEVSREGYATSEFAPQTAQDIGVVMCRPEGWLQTGEPGWSTGMESADGSRGVVALRLFQSRNLTTAENDRIAVGRALQLPDVGLPGGIDPAVLGEAQGASVIGYVPTWQLHAYPGGIAKITAVPLFDGSEIVVCVFGPDDWVADEEAGSMVTSVLIADPQRYAFPN